MEHNIHFNDLICTNELLIKKYGYDERHHDMFLLRYVTERNSSEDVTNTILHQTELFLSLSDCQLLQTFIFYFHTFWIHFKSSKKFSNKILQIKTNNRIFKSGYKEKFKKLYCNRNADKRSYLCVTVCVGGWESVCSADYSLHWCIAGKQKQHTYL